MLIYNINTESEKQKNEDLWKTIMCQFKYIKNLNYISFYIYINIRKIYYLISKLGSLLVIIL